MNPPGEQPESRPPTIGAVIPAYNRESTVRRAVESVVGQTRPPEEVVVVDDGSSDRTAARAASVDESVRVVRQANAGVSAARNRGVEELGTDWVAFLDSDDHWTKDHLSRIETAILATGGSADVYFDDVRSTELPDELTQWVMAGFSIDGEAHRVAADATEWVMQPLQPMAITGCVVRRERYLELGGMWSELRSREDTHLLFRLGFSGPFCAVDGVGVVMTGDDSSGQRLTAALGSTTDAYARFTIAMYRDLLDRHPGLAAEHAAELRERLMSGYLALASNQLRRGRPTGVAALLQAMRIDPAAALRRTIRAVTSRDG